MFDGGRNRALRCPREGFRGGAALLRSCQTKPQIALERGATDNRSTSFSFACPQPCLPSVLHAPARVERPIDGQLADTAAIRGASLVIRY